MPVIAITENTASVGTAVDSVFPGLLDTYIAEESPDFIRDGDTVLQFGPTAGEQTKPIFFVSGISNLPLGSTITNAWIEFQTGAGFGSLSANAYSLLELAVKGEANWPNFATGSAWGAAGATGVTDRTAAPSNAAPVTVNGGGTRFQIDITSAVQAYSDGTLSNLLIMLEGLTPGDFWQVLRSTATDGTRAQVIIDYAAGADTTPDPFPITPVTNAALNREYESELLTIGGINQAANVSIVGGEFSITGGAYQSAATTITDGETIRVRATSSTSTLTAVNVVLTVGTESETFTVTTGDGNTFLDNYSFDPVTDAEINTEYTSNAVPISDFGAPVSISIFNGTYSINGGAYTNTAGTVSDGDNITIRTTSPATFETLKSVLVSVNSINTTYQVTTRAAPTVSIDSVTGTIQADGQFTVNTTDLAVITSATLDGQALTIASSAANVHVLAVPANIPIAWDRSDLTLLVSNGSDSPTLDNQTLSARAGWEFVNFDGNVPIYDGASETESLHELAAKDFGFPAVVGDQFQIETVAGTTLSSNTVIDVVPTSSVVSQYSVFDISASAFVTGVLANANNGVTLFEQAFSVGTPATGPVQFSFTDVLSVTPGEARVAVVTLSGLTESVPVSVSGGEYQVGGTGGTWITTPGTVSNGQIVAVRGIASPTPFGTTDVTLTVNDSISDTFTITTYDLPDAFTFANVTDAPATAHLESNIVTISGMTGPLAISLASTSDGQEYRVNSGAWINTESTVNNGDTLQVRLDYPGNAGTENATVRIGPAGLTVSGTWIAQAADLIPDPFSFASQSDVALDSDITSNTITVAGITGSASIRVTSGIGEYSIDGAAFTSADGTVNNDQEVVFRIRSSTNNNALRSSILEIGATPALGISGQTSTFTITTIALADSTPDAFSFTPTTNADPGALVESNLITVEGIDAPVDINLNGVEIDVSVNGGAYVGVPGQVSNGQTVRFRATTSSSFDGVLSRSISIGDTSATWSITTRSADVTPAQFNFVDQTDATLDTEYTSNAITVLGIEVAVPISITGGTYSINGGAFVSTAGTVTAGQTVAVRVNSSPNIATAVNVTLDIGGVTDSYTVSTQGADTTPEPFSFTPVTEATRSTVYTSAEIGVEGINTAAPISIIGGEYSLDGGAFTSLAGTVDEFQDVEVRLTSSAIGSTQATATLTIGGVSASFMVTTAATQPPVFTGTIPNQNAMIGDAINLNLATYFSDVDSTMTFTSSGSLPGGLTLSLAGVLSGTLSASGNFTGLTIIANGDAGETPAQSNAFSFIVAAAPIDPSFTGTIPTLLGYIGIPLSEDLSSYFNDPDSVETFSLFAGTLPSGLTLSSAGVISGTPSVQGIANGIIVRASGDIGDTPANSNPFAYSIGELLSPVFSGPIPLQEPVVGEFYSLNVASFFSDANDPLTISLLSGSLPSGLTLTNGTVSGTPTTSGDFSAVFQAQGGPLDNPAVSNAVSFTVQPGEVVMPTLRITNNQAQRTIETAPDELLTYNFPAAAFVYTNNGQTKVKEFTNIQVINGVFSIEFDQDANIADPDAGYVMLIDETGQSGYGYKCLVTGLSVEAA